MGVDGIGSGGGGRPIGGVGGDPGSVAGVAAEAARDAAGAPRAERPDGSVALGQLTRGEIDLDAYLDVRVSEAVRHLEGKLTEAQLDFVRSSLREQLATDPVLIELVRRTT